MTRNWHGCDTADGAQDLSLSLKAAPGRGAALALDSSSLLFTAGIARCKSRETGRAKVRTREMNLLCIGRLN